MGTNYWRAGQTFLGRVTTSRFLMVTTAAAQQVVIGTGTTAVRLYNLGTGSVIWGDSSIAVNSGNYLFVSQAKEWGMDSVPVGFGWSVYLRADSVQGLVAITEYRNG